VGNVCTPGWYLRGVSGNGTLLCEPIVVPATSTTVDADGISSRGISTSIAIGRDGLPIIAHWNQSVDGLRVTHCGNPDCTADNVSNTVDDPPTAVVGREPSIAIGADGLPIISHRDASVEGLRVTHCGNLTCTSGNESRTIDDPAGHVGHDSSIAIGADGFPVISHQDFFSGVLRITHCGNATCSSNNVSTNVDLGTENVGGFPSIAIGTDGLPIVSHWNRTAYTVRVTHCGNVACTAGNITTTVDDPIGQVGGYTSIAIGSDGLPIIAHHDATVEGLRVTHCGNITCTSGNQSRTIDDAVDEVGIGPSMAIGVDGLPIISHWDGTIKALRVTHCGTVSCSAGNVSRTIDDPSALVGSDSSIAIGIDGLPVISHRNETNKALRVTRCATPGC
jgi:predicted regulator of Ras-like GTPase activity (Roadblock/LC7/MglB family)